MEGTSESYRGIKKREKEKRKGAGAMMMTTACLPERIDLACGVQRLLNNLNIPLSVETVCVFTAPIFSANAAWATYLLTKEVKGTGAGLTAAALLAMVPSYISRSVAGSYDNEAVAIFALIFTFYLYIKTLNTGSLFYATLNALSYFYMVCSWGGYTFIINLIPMHVLLCIVTGRYSSRLYIAYAPLVVLGTLLASLVPVVGFNAVMTSEHFASFLVFIILHVVALVYYIKGILSPKMFKVAMTLVVTIGIAVCSAVLAILIALVASSPTKGWSGRSLSLLDPTYASKYIPIIASVSEHQPPTWPSYFMDINVLAFLVPAGIVACFLPLSDASSFVILYIATSVYFSGVMVRLMLVLAPAACIMSGIALSEAFDAFTQSIKFQLPKLFEASPSSDAGDTNRGTQDEPTKVDNNTPTEKTETTAKERPSEKHRKKEKKKLEKGKEIEEKGKENADKVSNKPLNAKKLLVLPLEASAVAILLLIILGAFYVRCDELLGPLRAPRQRVSLPFPATVRCQARSGGELNGRRIAVDNTIKEVEPNSVEPVEDIEHHDGYRDEQFMMPWTVSVASGYTLLRNPQYNKGLAFNEKERDAHYLRGLLPPTCVSQELQEKKIMHNLRQYQVPLQRYMAMMDLQELNEKLFYKLLIDHVEELLPIVYTPTVGEACQKYGSIFRHPQGLYISLNEKGRILEVLRNWPERNIQVIVVTDGERILGLGDLGCQGMGIPVGKLALYTALGGVHPSACLPVTIDVGTNNEQLLNDEFYIGLRRRRATGQEYTELLEEFMNAVKQRYGEKILIQFEDFANHNAFELLAKYRKTHLVFNDDIQGTASVVLAGLFGALKIVGGTLAEHSFLFLGAGEAGTGIAELIALEMSKQTKAPLEETRKKIWMVDSKGLIVSSRKDSLQHFKQPWAHDHEPVNNLLDAIKAIKPTILIGSSGVGKTFTKEVVEAMTTFNEKPIILALSNPTSQSECSAEEAYTWSKGRAIFASGSPFDPIEYDGKVLVPGQSNNAYIFPGFGLGLVISGATRVHDDMLLAASEALAQQVTQENLDKGMVYPPFSNIRKISAHIAANVAAKAYELGLASRYPHPKDLVKYAESLMYNPVYHQYG